VIEVAGEAGEDLGYVPCAEAAVCGSVPKGGKEAAGVDLVEQAGILLILYVELSWVMGGGTGLTELGDYAAGCAAEVEFDLAVEGGEGEYGVGH
jgi:hypothetical protein